MILNLNLALLLQFDDADIEMAINQHPVIFVDKSLRVVSFATVTAVRGSANI